MEKQKFVPDNYAKFTYYKLAAIWYRVLQIIIPPDKVNYKDIPVIINNYNRLETLKKLISGLESRGYYNIHIIDNHSSNPGLLEYYKNLKYRVYLLDQNLGCGTLWKSGLFKKFKRNYFVYTDSDMVMVDECPDDFMNVFLNVLKRHPLAQKVGFSLKIDDLPDCYLLKDHVIDFEGQYYNYYLEDEQLYRAPIDSTFALYRPRAKEKHANNNIEIYRTAFPYMAYHLPWYQDSLNPDDDEKYYLEHLDSGYWYSSKSKRILDEHKSKLKADSSD